LKISVNSIEYMVEHPERTLLTFLRRELGLVGTRKGCNEGHCGSCTVLVDGRARKACVTRLDRLEGSEVETIENLGRSGSLHPLQAAFIHEGAVQCGFCTPGMIMAAKDLLDVNQAPTDEEIRRALRFNLCRCTGYASIFRAIRLAAQWLGGPSSQPALAGAHPAAPSGHPAVGFSVPKLDAVAKVTGAPIYADDLRRDHMLYGKLVYSGLPHARVVAVNTDEAKSLPGVVAVLTAVDVPGLNAFGRIIPHQPVLARDIVRYVGDPVAVVYAETEAGAEQAAALVGVTLEPLPGVFDPQDAMRQNAPKLYPNGNILNRTTVKKGDVGKGFELADVVVEDTYTTQCVEHAYLEPESALAEIDASGKLTVWAGGQGPHYLRHEIARALGYSEDQVRVILTATGGAFGGKVEPLIQIHAALGALKTGRPVKMTLTRRESIMKSTKRHPEIIYMKHGATRDGRLVAVEARIVADTGPYASLGMPVVSQSAAVAAGPYKVPNVHACSVGVYTNNAVGGAFRGFGTTQAAFAGELQIDRLARSLNMDPIEFRRRNALKAGDLTATGQVLEPSVAFDETLVAIKEALSKLDLPAADARKKIGVGVASAYKNVGMGGGSSDGAGATVELTDHDQVIVMTGAADIGQGSDTTLVQIAAAAGGFPLSRIVVISGDTDRCPDGGTTTASRQTFESGNAVYHAAAELGARLKKAAAELWNQAPEEIAFDDKGAVSGEKRLGYAELHRLLIDQGLEARVSYHYDPPVCYPMPENADHQPDANPEHYRIHYTYSFGTHAAVVEVDTETGEVRVLKVLAAHDVGKAIHPQNVRTQIEGSVVMGLGYGLMEEFKMSEGRVVTDTLKKLNLPDSTVVPEIEVYIIEDPQPGGPFGAKGFGELPMNPTAPAILNAIYDAVGVRLKELPAIPEKVLAAIRNKERLP